MVLGGRRGKADSRRRHGLEDSGHLGRVETGAQRRAMQGRRAGWVPAAEPQFPHLWNGDVLASWAAQRLDEIIRGQWSPLPPMPSGKVSLSSLSSFLAVLCLLRRWHPAPALRLPWTPGPGTCASRLLPALAQASHGAGLLGRALCWAGDSQSGAPRGSHCSRPGCCWCFSGVASGPGPPPHPSSPGSGASAWAPGKPS